jgi:hypothetical protein
MNFAIAAPHSCPNRSIERLSANRADIKASLRESLWANSPKLSAVAFSFWCRTERLNDLFWGLGYPFDSFPYTAEHPLYFPAAMTYPFDRLLYRFAFDACLLGRIADFMLLPTGDQLSVTAAATAAFLGTFCHAYFLLREQLRKR